VTFFDTNVLIYFTLDQDAEKLVLARQYIFEAIEQETMMISPLVLSEYIFVLAKNKVDGHYADLIDFFSEYATAQHTRETTLEAYALCKQINACRTINDAIHLKTAETHCDTLVTFDRDFARFQPHSALSIKILS